MNKLTYTDRLNKLILEGYSEHRAAILAKRMTDISEGRIIPGEPPQEPNPPHCSDSAEPLKSK